MVTLTTEKEEQLTQVPGEAVEFGAALHSALTDVGVLFGFYELMSRSGPLTSACLATQAGIPEQYARLWLDVQTAGNCLKHNPTTDLYCLWSSRLSNRQKV